MGRKEITIEGCDVPTLDLTFDVEFRYHCRPAQLYGPAENCHPEESESAVECIGINAVVDGYLSLLRPHLVKAIESKCIDLGLDGLPCTWDTEDRQAAEEDRAESILEERRLRA